MERASTMACSASLSDTTELQTEEEDTDWGHEIQGGRSSRDENVKLIICVPIILTLIEMLELTNEWLFPLLGSFWKSHEIAIFLAYFILSLHFKNL